MFVERSRSRFCFRQTAGIISSRQSLNFAHQLIDIYVNYARLYTATARLAHPIMTDFTSLLEQADVFYQIPQEYLVMIAAVCREQVYQSGEDIFDEGSSSDELYIIARGEVDILVDPGLVSDRPQAHPSPIVIATLRRGQSFGEIALVDQGMRSATARAAANDTRLLVIPRPDLIQLCDSHPDLGYHLMRNLAADLAMKIRNTDLLIREELLFSEK